MSSNGKEEREEYWVGREEFQNQWEGSGGGHMSCPREVVGWFSKKEFMPSNDAGN